MEVTKASEKDIERIYELNASLLSEGERWSKSMLEEDFKLSSYLVCKVEGKVVGFISFRNVLDECEIFQVCVDSNFQRQGIASKLLNAMLSENVNISKVFLEVNFENAKAIEFYKKNGFAIIGERKNYYLDKSAFNMMKVIFSSK